MRTSRPHRARQGHGARIRQESEWHSRQGRSVKVLSRQVIYQGRVIRLIREALQVQGQRIIRETVLHPGAVVIVPLLDRSRIVFVRQYRRAIGRELLELPAGTLDRRETLEVCARRELEEETGWRAGQLRYLGQFYAAPGFISERMTLFLARDLVRTQSAPEPDEFIEPVVLSLAASLRKIRSGEICDAKTLIGIWLAQQILEGRRSCLIAASRARGEA